MGPFATWRRRSTGGSGTRPSNASLTEQQKAALPAGFEAVGEALVADSSSILEVCWVVGHDQADAGVSLAECLEGLRSTTRLVRDRDPSYDELQTLSVAWSESTLGYLHGLSCTDPLTGLATLAHLRERIGSLYRDARLDVRRHALVVTQVGPVEGLDPIARARRLALLGDAARTVFSGQESIGKVGRSRVVVVASRDDTLVPKVSLLRRMVQERADRVWIEGLPGSDASAVKLLDELARGA